MRPGNRCQAVKRTLTTFLRTFTPELALDLVVVFVLRFVPALPLAFALACVLGPVPCSVLAIFFGRSLPSPSSLLRFLAGFGRFSAGFALPLGCWLGTPTAEVAGGGVRAKGVDSRATGCTDIESEEVLADTVGFAGATKAPAAAETAGRGIVTDIESCLTGGGGDGPLKDGLELSLIFLSS